MRSTVNDRINIVGISLLLFSFLAGCSREQAPATKAQPAEPVQKATSSGKVQPRPPKPAPPEPSPEKLAGAAEAPATPETSVTNSPREATGADITAAGASAEEDTPKAKSPKETVSSITVANIKPEGPVPEADTPGAAASAGKDVEGRGPTPVDSGEKIECSDEAVDGERDTTETPSDAGGADGDARADAVETPAESARSDTGAVETPEAAAAEAPEIAAGARDTGTAAEPLMERPQHSPALMPTHTVRIRVKSRQPNDSFISQATKHLYIGRNDIRIPDGDLLELPYSEVGDSELTMRIGHYEPLVATQSATAFAPDGVCELVFEATPHMAMVQFVVEPRDAELRNVVDGKTADRISAADRPLWLPVSLEHVIEVRKPGLQPRRIVIPPARPAATLPDISARCLPLPPTARPGQACRIALPAGEDMVLIWVPGGDVYLQDPYFAGSPPDVRVERIPGGFWIGKHEISRAQWRAVMGASDVLDELSGVLPQTGVTWLEARQFCRGLSAIIPNGGARLPSEAEWQHAAAAGRAGPYTALSAQPVIHAANSGGEAWDADKGVANPWNILHMSGNVREWCADVYAPYRVGESGANPALRVVRGGGFLSSLNQCQIVVRDSASQHARARDLGFRVIVVPDPIPKLK